jgi:phage/plasmid-like protein (TIGR03299 family)
MAHELDTKSNGQAAMAYVGEKAWHGLGQALTAESTIDEWKVEAGMDWMAEVTPVIFQAGGKTFRQNSKNVLYRNDTLAPLSIVSSKYKIVQPDEILEFFTSLTSDAGFQMETAGCLYGGKKLWALAKTGKSVKIAGVDEIKPYLLLGTSMDGSMATSAHFTSVRVVCNNTLRMAIGNNGQRAQIKIPHMAAFNSDAVKVDLGLAADAWDSFIESAQTLTTIKLDREEAIQIVASEMKNNWLDADGNSMLPMQMVENSKELKAIMDLYNGQGLGSQLISAKNTAWGLVNAVTQYMDHESPSKGVDRSKQFDRAQFGDRANFKTNVANKLLDLI